MKGQPTGFKGVNTVMEMNKPINKPEKPSGGRPKGIFSNVTLAPGGYEDALSTAESSGVVHIFEAPSRTDLACLRTAYSANGLPAPKRDGLNPDKGKATALFLSKNGRNINADIQNLGKLIAWQKKNDFPVVLLPQLILYGKRPGRTGPGKWYDKWTGPEDRPKLLRKWLQILSTNGGAVAQGGEAINLKDFIVSPQAKGLSNAAAARLLLDTLKRDFHSLRRAVLGPPVTLGEVMKEKVRSHPLLINTVVKEAADSRRSEWQVWQEVDESLDSIMADYDVRFIRVWEKILSWVWHRFFQGVAVDNVGLERVRKLAQKSPVIYVPCHKSHTDYLLVSYVLFVNHMTPPHIAAGANLNFWPLGYIFRHSGAFFLKRSLRGSGIYAAVFEAYLRTLMREGFDLEFFIEGGRSRTGKLFLPKMGLLSMTIKAFEEGDVPDLNFVPISISYDRVPEEEELLGETQLMRMIPPGWRGVWRVLSRNNGLIHLNFGAPVSLREYLESRNAEPLRMETEERRALYRDFGFRLIRSINDVSVATPNAVAAAALLARKSYAVEEMQLQKDAARILKYLEYSHARIAPTLHNAESAVSNALEVNRAQNYIQDLSLPGEEDKTPLISVDPDKRPNLEMYKNNVLHVLYPASFVSTSLLSRSGRAPQAKIEEDFGTLTLLLKYELVYDADRIVGTLINETLEFFEAQGAIIREGDGRDATWSVTDAGREALPVFAGQIENFLEAYKLVLNQEPPKEGESEDKYARKMVHTGLREYHLGKIERRESISLVTFRNARLLVKHLEKIGKSRLADPEVFSRFLKR